MADPGAGGASPPASPSGPTAAAGPSLAPKAVKDRFRSATIRKRLKETAQRALRARRDTQRQLVPSLRNIANVQPHIVRKLCTTGSSTLMLTEYGKVYVWGDPDSSIPHLLHGLDSLTIKDIACGRDHYCAVSEESTWNLYTWGGNTRGQLGTGDYEPRKEPQRVTALTPTAEEVVAGDDFTIVRCMGGDVVGFGRNDRDQLGTRLPGPDRVLPIYIERLSSGSEEQLPLKHGIESGDYRKPTGAVHLAAHGSQGAMWTSHWYSDRMISPAERWEAKELERLVEHLGHSVRSSTAEYRELQARLSFPKFCPTFYTEADAYIRECTTLLKRNIAQRNLQARKVEWLREQAKHSAYVAREQEAELRDGQLRLSKLWRSVTEQEQQVERERKALDAQSPEERDDFHLKQLQERLHSANAELREDKRHLDALFLSVERNRGRCKDVMLRLLQEQHLASDHDKEVDLLFRLRLRRLKILQRKLLQDRDDYFQRVVQTAHTCWQDIALHSPKALTENKRLVKSLAHRLGRTPLQRDIVRFSTEMLRKSMAAAEERLVVFEEESSVVEGSVSFGAPQRGQLCYRAGANVTILTQYSAEMDAPISITDCSVDMDGAGAESGAQVVTGVVYDMDTRSGEYVLIGASIPQRVEAGPAAKTRQWRQLSFRTPIQLEPRAKQGEKASAYWFGVHVNDSGAQVVRLYGTGTGGNVVVPTPADRSGSVPPTPPDTFGQAGSPESWLVRVALHAPQAGLYRRMIQVLRDNYWLRVQHNEMLVNVIEAEEVKLQEQAEKEAREAEARAAEEDSGSEGEPAEEGSGEDPKAEQ